MRLRRPEATTEAQTTVRKDLVRLGNLTRKDLAFGVFPDTVFLFNSISICNVR